MEAILAGLDTSVDKINNFTQTALKDPSSAKQVVAEWIQNLNHRLDVGSDLLPSLYAVNDLAQESKKIGENRFVVEFENVLVANLGMALRRRPDLKSLFRRVLEIWITRKVFSKHILRDLREELDFVHISDDGLQESEEEAEPDHQSGEANSQDIATLRARTVEAFSLPKLLGLWSWISEQFASAGKTIETAEAVGDSSALLETPIERADVSGLLYAMDTLAPHVRQLRELELALEIHEIVHAALIKALEKDVQRAEQSLSRAVEELGQIPVIESAVASMEDIKDSRGFITATYALQRLVPKKRKVKTVNDDIAPVISLYKVGDKRTGGQMFDKAKQAYVPLPSADEEPAWRS